MQAVLVTGGAGYIGSHTCKLLRQRGYLPVVLDNLIYGHEAFVKWGPFVHGDISDRSVLDTVFSTYKPSAVIHFAAFAYVGESVVHPSRYYRNNVCGTLSLLEAMRLNGCKNIIFSSSCATYGEPTGGAIDERHSQMPINPYGRSKLMVENILHDYDRAYGIKSISLRYFNAAGADPEGEIGEDHQPETHLIPLALYSLINPGGHIHIYGTDFATPDGTAVRDYIHVSDLSTAHVLSLGKLTADGMSDVFNLGTGRGASVLEVVRSIERVSGMTVPVKYAPRRAGDPAELVADPLKAKTVLGWSAQYGNLDEITASAWNWHKSRHAGEG